MSSEKSSKAESNIYGGRRLLFAVIVLLAGLAVILTACVIVMDEEIKTLRENVAEYQKWKDENGDKKTVSTPATEHRSSLEELSKRKRVRLSRSKQSRCESLRIPMCRNMPYSSAQFPNFLNHQTQDDAIALANVLGPLVKSGCSSSIEHFLCSVLAPPCGGAQQPIPPCKGLCKRATKSCRDLLNKFQITLDPSMRCKNLPKEGTSKCFNGSWPKSTNTPTPASAHSATKCRPVTHQCNRFLPPNWQAQFPNYFGHKDAREASVSFQKFEGILRNADKDCSATLSTFLCGLHVPPCRKTKRPLLPCREFCLKARSQCKREMRLSKRGGLQWPSILKCRNFPGKDEEPCYNGQITPEPTTKPQPTVPGKCEVLTVPLCKNIPYNMTEFPNFFRHKTQAEASLEVQQFSPLVQINCSPDLAFFLCTLYTPICTSLDKPPLPCRELCVRVREGCLPLLLKFNFKWPEAMNCEQFSRRGDSICIDRPDVATVATPSPSPSPSPVIQPQAGKCEPLRVPACSAFHYSKTKIPNFLHHQTQDQASLELSKFDAVIQTNCSQELAFFLCSLFAPPCSPHPYTAPCKELCSRVRKQCISKIRQLGMKWPVSCSKFSRKSEVPVCLDAPPSPRAPILTTTNTLGNGKCETTTIPICKGLQHFNMTLFPNFLNHDTRDEAALEVQQFSPLVQFGCSPDLSFFLCSLYAPSCSAPFKPCRDLCISVKKGCLPILEEFGIPWPEKFACDKFPAAGPGTQCTAPQQSVISNANQTTSGRCEALTIPLCQDLHYNMTLFPNFFNHRKQEEAALEVHQYFPLVKIGCSPDLSLFLCSLYAPSCIAPFKPCRDICISVRRGCLPLMQRFGFTWPKNMACDNFPIAGQGTECIVSPSSVLSTAPSATRSSK